MQHESGSEFCFNTLLNYHMTGTAIYQDVPIRINQYTKDHITSLKVPI